MSRLSPSEPKGRGEASTPGAAGLAGRLHSRRAAWRRAAGAPTGRQVEAATSRRHAEYWRTTAARSTISVGAPAVWVNAVDGRLGEPEREDPGRPLVLAALRRTRASRGHGRRDEMPADLYISLRRREIEGWSFGGGSHDGAVEDLRSEEDERVDEVVKDGELSARKEIGPAPVRLKKEGEKFQCTTNGNTYTRIFHVFLCDK